MRIFTCAVLLAFPCLAVDVLTSEYNNNRTGHSPTETILTPANVSGGTFGLLGSYPVDDVIYAHVLAVDAYPFASGTKSAIIVGTMNNTLYCFDQASFGASALIWSRHFNAPEDISLVPSGTVHGYRQFLAAGIGIMATPVIDKANGFIYVVHNDGTAGSITTGWKVAKVNLADGAVASDTQIIAKFTGTGNQLSSPTDTQDGSGNYWFNGHFELNRIPLGLSNGLLTIAWSAYGDQQPGNGEIIQYQVSDMTVAHTWTAMTAASSVGLNSLWQSGRGMPIDASGNTYTMTGNGDFNGTNNFGDSWVKLSSTMALSDWYSPNNNAQINAGDWDVSSSGPMLIPGTNWLIGGAKDRLVRVLNTANMGHSDPGNGTSPTKVTAINSCNTACAYAVSGIYNQAYSPANTMVYESDNDGPLYGLPFNESTGVLSAPSIQTSESFGFPGAFISVSSNGTSASSAIVWANVTSGQPGNIPSGGIGSTYSAFQNYMPGRMMAFRATDLTVLYDSNAAPLGRDQIGSMGKFQPPMPINGRVYLPTFASSVKVFGLGAPAAAGRTVIGVR